MLRNVSEANRPCQVMKLYESLILDDPGRLTKQALVSGVGTGASQGLMFSLYWIAFLYGGYLIEATGTPR